MDPADLENRFTFHPATPEQVPKYERIRANALAVAQMIDQDCADGREKSLAITHLEEVVFWANASIARTTSTSPAVAAGDPIPGLGS